MYTDGQGLALQGYDPVAFFKLKKAIKGSDAYEIKDTSRTWRFVSQAHLDAFEEDRARFMPAYGGYDAWGVARGYKRRTDPTLWVEGAGRIFLFYSVTHQNLWAGDIEGNIALGDVNWPDLERI
ncbi:MAG: YHS domain-containing (seleno)protein [Pseudomonadota bacterium]